MVLGWLCKLPSVFKYFRGSKESVATTHSDSEAATDRPEGCCY